MGHITDTKNRSWNIEINVATVSRVRKRLDINLLELVLSGNTLVDRLSDPVMLVDVLYVLCEDQCQAVNVSDEEFGRSLTRDNVDQGLDLILEGVVSFSPRALRPALTKVLEKARKYEAAQAGKIKTAVDSPEFDAALETEIKKRLEIPENPPTDFSTAAGNLEASSV